MGIKDFFSGVGNAISSFISGAGEFIRSAAGKIGAAISNFAESAVKVISNIAVHGIDLEKIVSAVADFIHAIGAALGITSEDDPEVLGAKAEQSDKRLDDFDNDVEKYIEYLKNEVELDKEKFAKMSSEEKLGCKAIGMSLETKAIESKIGGIEIHPDCLATLAAIQAAGIPVDPNRTVIVLNSLKDSGITNMSDISEYLSGKGDSDRLKTGEALHLALGEGADDRISELKDAVRQYEGE